MTEEERLERNTRIREQGKQTRARRKGQVCRVFRVKIDISHLNEAQKIHLSTYELEYLGSQMKQSVIQGIKHSLKGLATLKKHSYTVGNLRHKSDYVSINLQQHRVTYRFYDQWHVGMINSMCKRTLAMSAEEVFKQSRQNEEVIAESISVQKR